MGLRGPLPSRVSVGSLKVPPAELERPEMPAFVAVDPAAAECFAAACGHLEAAGVLRASHGMALGILASEWSRYIVAAEASRAAPLVTGGSGGPKANPAAAVASAAAKQCIDILGKFGLTLAALGTCTVPAAAANSGGDLLAEFAARRQARRTSQ